MVKSYQLSISPEYELYRPEIEYVCDFIDYCHGLERTTNSETILHYGLTPQVGAVNIPAILFQNSINIDERGLTLDIESFSKIEKGILPNKDSNPESYDAVGLIFLLLSRIEEKNATKKDQYNRYSYGADYTVRHNYYGQPMADQAAYEIASALTNGRQAHMATKFSVRLTHDVDMLCGYHHFMDPLRTSVGDIVKSRGLKRAFERLSSAYFGNEPWNSFNDLMNSAEENNLCARFYLMGPSIDKHDSPYAINQIKSLQKIAKNIICRGHLIGFHPGYATYNESELWKKQRDDLEYILEVQVKEGRQHMLRYDVVKTPSIWEDAGMEEDFTMAYPERSGFRNGTCRIFKPYDLSKRKAFRFKQGSTSIMDFSFFGHKYRDLEIKDALEECNSIINICKHYGGELVILFHTGQTNGKKHDFYKELLSVLN